LAGDLLCRLGTFEAVARWFCAPVKVAGCRVVRAVTSFWAIGNEGAPGGLSRGPMQIGAVRKRPLWSSPMWLDACTGGRCPSPSWPRFGFRADGRLRGRVVWSNNNLRTICGDRQTAGREPQKSADIPTNTKRNVLGGPASFDRLVCGGPEFMGDGQRETHALEVAQAIEGTTDKRQISGYPF